MGLERGLLNIMEVGDNDILDVEAACYVCDDLVMLGNDYQCHLNYAHDIFDLNNTENSMSLKQNSDEIIVKNQIYQCEICRETFKGRAVTEAHINNLHLDIVKELEEDVTDFYVVLQAVSGYEKNGSDCRRGKIGQKQGETVMENPGNDSVRNVKKNHTCDECDFVTTMKVL